MVVGSGDKIMAGRGWWQQHFGWPGVVVGGGNRIMADRGWSWMVALLLRYKKMNKRIEFCVTLFQYNHHSLTTNKFLDIKQKNCFSIKRCAKFVGHVQCPTVISHPANYELHRLTKLFTLNRMQYQWQSRWLLGKYLIVFCIYVKLWWDSWNFFRKNII